MNPKLFTFENKEQLIAALERDNPGQDMGVYGAIVVFTFNGMQFHLNRFQLEKALELGFGDLTQYFRSAHGRRGHYVCTIRGNQVHWEWESEERLTLMQQLLTDDAEVA